MALPATTEDHLHRAAIDGRVAFGVAVLLSGIGLLALMDRVGVPDGLVRALAPIFVLCGLITIAALLRTMRVSWFYAAGRAIPAPYAGLAMASLGAALFLPFIPPVPQGTSLTELFAGFACGMTCAALVTGPLLRKTGAFSVPDLIAARFPHLVARLGAILLVACVSILVALAAYQEALSTLIGLSDFSKPLASAIIASLLIFIILPGGLASTLWIASASTIVALTVFGLPLVITALHGGKVVFPLIGSAPLWADALVRIEAFTGAAQAKDRMDPLLIAAIALGLGVLAPLLAPSITCRDRRSAQRAGVSALGWGGILILLATATLGQASLTLDRLTVGQAADNLPPSLYRASAEGELSICGASVGDRLAARRACAARPGFSSALRLQDITAKGFYLLTGFAEFGSAFAGLGAAVILVIGLGLAAIGIQTSATVLGNDMFYRVRDHSALTSRRLAVTRAFAIAIIALIGAGLSLVSLYPQTLIALAILLSAAGIAPLLMLALWPRATSVDATIALLIGLLSAEVLIGVKPLASGFDRFAVSALLACTTSLLAGLLTSLLRRQTANEGSTFTHAILHDSGEWLHPDKGV
jgi:cation/acetate symporter